MIRALAITLLVFVMMEFVSYLVHRFIYHNLLWVLHKSHHTRREGVFELNDLFPLAFAAVTIMLLFHGLSDPAGSDFVAVAVGMTLYGAVYFFIHDLYVHRRAKWLKLRLPFLMKIKKAHAIHHRDGGEPYGLLFFSTGERAGAVPLSEEDRV